LVDISLFAPAFGPGPKNTGNMFFDAPVDFVVGEEGNGFTPK
jgi:hypothetical protein